MREFSKVDEALFTELKSFSADWSSSVRLGDFSKAASETSEESGCSCKFIHHNILYQHE